MATATVSVKGSAKVSRRGRPLVYKNAQRRSLAKHLRKFGLTHGLAAFEAESGIKVSAVTGLKVAKEFGVTFSRGRPKLKV